VIQLKDINKTYNNGAPLHVLKGINLDIKRGEFVSIMGASGSGKSTLLNILGILDNYDTGEYYLNGTLIKNLSETKAAEYRNRMIGFIFQSFNLISFKNAVENVALPLFYQGVSRRKRNAMALEYLDRLGLKDWAHHMPNEMSGGQRQRIVIARALILEPKFIFCDEPVSALDVSIQAQILNLLMDLQEEKNLTYMFITHDMSVVKHISDDIAVMYLGQVVEKAEYQELFARPLHPYSQALFSAIPVPSIHNRQKRIVLKGEITSPVNPKPCCRFAARCPYATDLCREREPELRDMGNTHFVKCHRVEELNK